MSPPLQQTGLPLMELPLMSSAVVSRAKTSALPEKASGLKVSEAVFGANLPGLSAKSAQLGSLLKTSLRCEIEERTRFSVTWKRSATPGGRVWWVLSMSERRIKETGSGLLPTPRAEGKDAMGRDASKSLLTAVRFWPTPNTVDAKGGTRKGNGQRQLCHVVRVPTPTARDWKSGSHATQGERGRIAGPNLAEWTGGQLNPPWVEWLMGFPIGWTACDASETQLSLSFQSCSGEQS